MADEPLLTLAGEDPTSSDDQMVLDYMNERFRRAIEDYVLYGTNGPSKESEGG